MLVPHLVHFDPTQYTLDPQTGAVQHQNPGQPAPALHKVAFEVAGPVPPFSKVRVRLKPFNDPANPRTVMPGNVPDIAVYLVERYGNVYPMITGQDSTPLPLYGEAHDVELAPTSPNVLLPIVFDQERFRLRIVIEDEYGTDAFQGTRIESVELLA